MAIPDFVGKKDKRLGVSQGKRKYDLPLNNDEGARFLVLLISLMTFLAVMALAFSFSLGGLVERWSSGLENKLTIEIPAENAKGKIRESKDVQALAEKVSEALKENKALHSVEILDKEDIGALLEPWLGAGFTDNSVIADIPIPALISAEIVKNTTLDLDVLKYELAKIVPNIVLDQHEDWLGDLLRFTGSLQLSAAVVVFIIVFTTLIAVAGAIRSRMAEYKDDVELLHLMGARDEYITKQFQRHARLMGLQGGAIGVGLGFLAMLAISGVFGNMEDSALPELKLSVLHYAILLFVPVFMCVVTSFGARYTVLRVLARMP